MSILIPGMEMPIDCCDCPMSGDYRMCCSLMPGVPALYAEFADAIKTNRRHKDCPLVPVPPHGDLIDRDAIKFDWDEDNQTWGYDIYSAPTIIEAESEGTE